MCLPSKADNKYWSPLNFMGKYLSSAIYYVCACIWALVYTYMCMCVMYHVLIANLIYVCSESAYYYLNKQPCGLTNIVSTSYIIIGIGYILIHQVKQHTISYFCKCTLFLSGYRRWPILAYL